MNKQSNKPQKTISEVSISIFKKNLRAKNSNFSKIMQNVTGETFTIQAT